MWREQIKIGLPTPDVIYTSPFRRAIHTSIITFNGWFYPSGDEPGIEASKSVKRIVIEVSSIWYQLIHPNCWFRTSMKPPENIHAIWEVQRRSFIRNILLSYLKMGSSRRTLFGILTVESQTQNRIFVLERHWTKWWLQKGPVSHHLVISYPWSKRSFSHLGIISFGNNELFIQESWSPALLRDSWRCSTCLG